MDELVRLQEESGAVREHLQALEFARCQLLEEITMLNVQLEVCACSWYVYASRAPLPSAPAYDCHMCAQVLKGEVSEAPCHSKTSGAPVKAKTSGEKPKKTSSTYSRRMQPDPNRKCAIPCPHAYVHSDLHHMIVFGRAASEVATATRRR